MGRWEPNAAGRLREAAMELFAERGFEQTTVADIAERAGLTARTFFRHFADKREVLFAGSEQLQEAMVQALEGASADASAFDAVAAAVLTAAQVLGGHRAMSRQRRDVIVANAELHERELIKFARLGEALTAALHRRQVAEPEASLAAEAGTAVFRVGFERWVAEGERRSLAEVLADLLDRFRALAQDPA